MAALASLPSEQWNEQYARHLLNRAGFGVPHHNVQMLYKLGLQDAVDWLLRGAPGVDETAPPDFILPPRTPQQIRQELADRLNEKEIRERIKQLQQDERGADEQLKAWWLARMAATEDPLVEKMALFWHGHFATSSQKVKSSWHNWAVNATFRRHALGNLKALTTEVAQSPAMLIYLDNARSTARKPNENWARELMELFTLGPGNYGEEDIRESARAFTGWTHDGKDFAYRLRNHDSGEKRFLGEEGRWDGWNIIDIIFEQDAAAQFLATKLWRYFAGEAEDQAAVAELASLLRQHDYELAPTLRALFTSQAFYTPEVVGAQIKSPVQWAVQLSESFSETPVRPEALARACRQLEQDLFRPPNVKGWDGNRAWISAHTLLLRCNLPVMLLSPAGRTSPEQPYEQQKTDELLAKLPEKVAEGYRRRLNKAPDGAAKSVIQRGIEERLDPSRQPAMMFIAGLKFSTAGECMQALEERLLSQPLRSEQRQRLMAAAKLPAPEAPLGPRDIKPWQAIILLRLFTSLAEYQLC